MKRTSSYRTNMDSHFKTFTELNTTELYKILKLRSEVFVVEQNCAYQDIDDADLQAIHQLIWKKEQLIAYSRILPPGSYFEQLSIGRILTASTIRGQQYGHLLMQEAIGYCQEQYPYQSIKLSAQQYLIEFYRSHGFEITGKGYLEDGIPHIGMIRDSK